MRTKTFTLFLLSIGLIVTATLVQEEAEEQNIQHYYFVFGGIFLAAIIVSIVGLISGIRKLSLKAQALVWIGVIGNLFLTSCYAFAVFMGIKIYQSGLNAPYDPTKLINGVSANYDTINHGEEYVITVRNDSSYSKRFGERPLIKVFDNHFHPISSEYWIQLHQVEEVVEGVVEKKIVPLKLKVKVTPKKDTVLTLDKTYYVTNFSSTSRSEGQLKNGLKEGLWRFWYDNKRKHLKEEAYWSTGKLHGVRTLYWKNGNIMRAYNYQDGNLNGMSYWYSSRGEIDDSIYYKNNKAIKITEH